MGLPTWNLRDVSGLFQYPDGSLEKEPTEILRSIADTSPELL